MTRPPVLSFRATDLDTIADAKGRIVVIVGHTGKLDQMARRVNRLTRGALERFAESDTFGKMAQGEARDLAFPTGLEADAVQIVKLDPKPGVEEARKAGVAIGRGAGRSEVLVLAGRMPRLADVALGAALRAYDFTHHKTQDKDGGQPSLTFMVPNPGAAEESCRDVSALAEGVFFARDLVNEPSNVLTTKEFARQLEELKALGAEVTVIDEPELEALGLRALLAVGQGSESPSKVVTVAWKNGGKSEPLALVGKGVVFDTGGISLKPAAGMEDMTMDMGGAATVAGVMKALALRQARVNVVGLVGLVENMPDGRAQRPGDVVRTMKGDTVEVINTDAEGRLVLCDVLWLAQERFKPTAVIDLATLTGAVVMALGHENAGVFSNDDPLCEAFLKAAAAEQEGAWRLPLGKGYAKQLKSQVADVKNVGGRPAGSVTAAEFLARFIKDDTAWIHLDIAGVASLKSEGPYSPKGATGWGVLALNRLIADWYEG
jgi:leucyl aminopeptidase